MIFKKDYRVVEVLRGDVFYNEGSPITFMVQSRSWIRPRWKDECFAPEHETAYAYLRSKGALEEIPRRDDPESGNMEFGDLLRVEMLSYDKFKP